MAGRKSIYTAGNNSKVCLRGTLLLATFLHMEDMLLQSGTIYSLVSYETSIHHDHQMHLLCSGIRKRVRDYLLGVYNLR